jgi:hypothetical protein
MPEVLTHRLSADEVRHAMAITHGSCTLAAARFGMSRQGFYTQARRMGIDMGELRRELRAKLGDRLHAEMVADQPQWPTMREDAPVSGDALPSARPVLASALVDMASMGLEVLRLQTELEQSNRIIASLTASLQAVGAHLEAA